LSFGLMAAFRKRGHEQDLGRGIYRWLRSLATYSAIVTTNSRGFVFTTYALLATSVLPSSTLPALASSSNPTIPQVASLSKSSVIGITIPVVGLFLLLAFIFIVCIRRRRRWQTNVKYGNRRRGFKRFLDDEYQSMASTVSFSHHIRSNDYDGGPQMGIVTGTTGAHHIPTFNPPDLRIQEPAFFSVVGSAVVRSQTAPVAAEFPQAPRDYPHMDMIPSVDRRAAGPPSPSDYDPGPSYFDNLDTIRDVDRNYDDWAGEGASSSNRPSFNRGNSSGAFTSIRF